MPSDTHPFRSSPARPTTPRFDMLTASSRSPASATHGGTAPVDHMCSRGYGNDRVCMCGPPLSRRGWQNAFARSGLTAPALFRRHPSCVFATLRRHRPPAGSFVTRRIPALHLYNTNTYGILVASGVFIASHRRSSALICFHLRSSALIRSHIPCADPPGDCVLWRRDGSTSFRLRLKGFRLRQRACVFATLRRHKSA